MQSLKRGISIHGMKLLRNPVQPVSLRALKEYDRRGENQEITNLKQLANKMPADKYEDKTLSPEAFETWNLYGKEWVEWWNAPIKIREIWQHLQCDPVPSPTHSTDIVMFFSIHKDVIEQHQLVSIAEDDMEQLLNDQMSAEFQRLVRKPSHPDNLIFGWVRYTISANNRVILIKEFQSPLELKENSKYKALTGIVLTEFMRVMANCGFQYFETLHSEAKRELAPDELFPYEVYGKMLTRMGFERSVSGVKMQCYIPSKVLTMLAKPNYDEWVKSLND